MDCVTCQKNETEVRIHKCPICFRPTCEDCGRREYGRVFCSPRRVRFVEMEYGIPFDAVPDAIGRIVEMHANSREELTGAQAGDIVAVAGVSREVGGGVGVGARGGHTGELEVEALARGVAVRVHKRDVRVALDRRGGRPVADEGQGGQQTFQALDLDLAGRGSDLLAPRLRTLTFQLPLCGCLRFGRLRLLGRLLLRGLLFLCLGRHR